MSDPTPQDRDDSFNFTTEVDDLLRRAVLRFGRWMAENWTMSADEARTLTEPTTAPAEYARGYNDAVRQIRHACETWIEGGQE